MGKAMTTAAQTTLMHTAELLEEDARWLRIGHAKIKRGESSTPDWSGEPEMRALHDDALCTALELRLLAKRINDGQIAPYHQRRLFSSKAAQKTRP